MPHSQPSTDFELLFENAPISLWLEDYSALKLLFGTWRAQGVTDLIAFLRAHPEHIAECSRCYKVLKVNQQTLKLLNASSQQELLDRLPEVFRADMFEEILVELRYLWNGVLDFTSESVNYGLDGRRIDVQVRVRILQGHEEHWDRVMVSLEDVTERKRALQQLQTSEHYARNLFAFSPVSLWVEDFSAVKMLMDEVRHSGIQDFRVFLSVHPDFVPQCMEKIRVLDVNQQTLDMFAATGKSELLDNLGQVFRDEMSNSFAEQLIDLWNGKTVQTREVVNYSLRGDVLNIHLQFAVLPGHETHWDLVLISMVDITARKKAEAYLEYLGKHDALTHLRNRAFYVEELNRISRKGPWPLSIVAMDLNGLKVINDSQGHAAGDAVLRRVGEVLHKAVQDKPYCVARTGGDEFVALMPGCDERAAQGLIDNIQSILELNNQFYPGQKLNLAIGRFTCAHASEVEHAIHAADQAMFSAKKNYYEESNLERRRG
jgi:diguanylate cyclase (GGDEF)-like protein